MAFTRFAPDLLFSIYIFVTYFLGENLCKSIFSSSDRPVKFYERGRARTLLALRDWNETIHFVPSSFPDLHDD